MIILMFGVVIFVALLFPYLQQHPIVAFAISFTAFLVAALLAAMYFGERRAATLRRGGAR